MIDGMCLDQMFWGHTCGIKVGHHAKPQAHVTVSENAVVQYDLAKLSSRAWQHLRGLLMGFLRPKATEWP